ncbi:MAG: hypothetical protein VX589_15880 [Myxococcota bacterium]|nr:hypothetical protein [Myxococcota bacterium]
MPTQENKDCTRQRASETVPLAALDHAPFADSMTIPSQRGGPQGTARTRAQVSELGHHILSYVGHRTIREAAAHMGLDYFDIKNLRAGNQASLNMVLKLVTIGYFNPDHLLSHGTFVQLRGRARSRVRGLTKAMISKQIRVMSASRPAKEWSKLTGLTPASIYQLRKNRKQISLHTVLAFIHAGAKIRQIFRVPEGHQTSP